MTTGLLPSPGSRFAFDAAGRRDLYALCARIFAAEVDVELYRILSSDGVAGLCRAGGVELVEPELDHLASRDAVDELAIEYCRLFIGPAPLCPPYASTTIGEVLLGGRSRAGLEHFLARHGVTIAEGARFASPDHVAVELSVLAHLYSDLAAAAEGGVSVDAPASRRAATAVREFLRDHVLSWMPRFLGDVERHANRALYRSVAHMARVLLEEERDQFGL